MDPPSQNKPADVPLIPQHGLPSGALDTLLKNIKPFTGKPPGPTWESWKQSLLATVHDYYPQMSEGAQFRLTIALLHDDIRDLIIKAGKDTQENFEPFMVTTYPASQWAEHYDAALHAGTLFKGKNIHVACTIATDAAWQLGGTSHWCTQVTKALLAEFHSHLVQAPNDLWEFTNYTAGDMTKRFTAIAKAVLASQARQAALRTAPGHGQANQATTQTVSSYSMSAQVLRDQLSKGNRDTGLPSTESLVAAVLAAIQGGVPTANNTNRGGVPIKAAADQGAATSVITRDTATRLHLKIDQQLRPHLRAFGGPHYAPTLGTTRARFATSESPRKRWIKFTVIEANTEIDALIGRQDLDSLDLDLRLSPELMAAPPACPPVIHPEQPRITQRETLELRGLPAETFRRIDPIADQEFRKANDQYPLPTRQSAPRSQADREFMAKYIKTRLQYGVDEPGSGLPQKFEIFGLSMEDPMAEYEQPA
ncbi:hypothetical protein BJ085DRAFT_36886 [Dimargaris cristalligena]|uniref:Uncharacterized protein n=1 Tax=Dimargaris cristalligena TaxID=215637 RepID=A0A4P9ZRQ6_9FUNG|nr:hypothetical protein BJ085DRAFT_36886 [Dimargaris cristalligena]|eukprot:RKP36143.1 hypothetical protein BJ085DRAFT_36886 [Dimargaris cristalligena]